MRSTPICLVPREDLEPWQALSAAAKGSRREVDGAEPGEYGRAILEALDASGPSFAADLARRSKLLGSHFDMGLAQLVSLGLVTCDSFAGMRRLIPTQKHKRGTPRRTSFAPAGRWSRFGLPAEPAERLPQEHLEFAARRLLERYGVIVRPLLERERIPVPWRDLVRAYRRLELRGEVRGGRFVQRFSGEHYALPEAVERMRALRRDSRGPEVGGVWVSAADPLNLGGILTPDPRVPLRRATAFML
jgi:ATP-dependent Lhr-like helicase